MAPSLSILKALFGMSGACCAYPGCSRRNVDPVTLRPVAEVAHIRARRPGGPRYDAEQTDAERHGFENLILLCPSHHTEVDSDAERFTVSQLNAWKKQAQEAKGSQQTLVPSDDELQELRSALTVVEVTHSPGAAMASGGSVAATGTGVAVGRDLNVTMPTDSIERVWLEKLETLWAKMCEAYGLLVAWVAYARSSDFPPREKAREPALFALSDASACLQSLRIHVTQEVAIAAETFLTEANGAAIDMRGAERAGLDHDAGHSLWLRADKGAREAAKKALGELEQAARAMNHSFRGSAPSPRTTASTGGGPGQGDPEALERGGELLRAPVSQAPLPSWPPLLSDAQRTLLERVAKAWRSSGEWPTYGELSIEWKNQGIDLKEIVGGLQRGICHLQHPKFARDDDKLDLTIAGVALTRGAKALVEKFLRVLKGGVAAFIKAPHDRRQVTAAYLRRIVTDGGPSERLRVRRLFAAELATMKSVDGDWISWEPGLRWVALHDLEEIWDYAAWKYDLPRRPKAVDLAADDFIRLAYAVWSQSKEWPNVADFVIEHRTHGDVLEWLMGHQEHFINPRLTGEKGDLLRARLDAVARAVPKAPELDVFVRILKAVRGRYMRTKGKGQLSDATLASKLSVPRADLRRVGEWFFHEPESGVVVSSERSKGWIARGDKAIRDWDQLDDIQDYIVRRDAIRLARSSS